MISYISWGHCHYGSCVDTLPSMEQHDKYIGYINFCLICWNVQSSILQIKENMAFYDITKIICY